MALDTRVQTPYTRRVKLYNLRIPLELMADLSRVRKTLGPEETLSSWIRERLREAVRQRLDNRGSGG